MKSAYLLLLVVGLLWGANLPAHAAERVQVCARYQQDYGWSQSYRVEAQVMDGSELNQATNSMQYSSMSTYVVIFWDQGEASVIEMQGLGLTAVTSRGIDQQGRTWKVSKGGIC